MDAMVAAAGAEIEAARGGIVAEGAAIVRAVRDLVALAGT
jgi:hypothetical protein